MRLIKTNSYSNRNYYPVESEENYDSKSNITSEPRFTELMLHGNENSQAVDFEDLVENQDESEMPVHVIWLAIESKHLNGIARFWTIFSIAI